MTFVRVGAGILAATCALGAVVSVPLLVDQVRALVNATPVVWWMLVPAPLFALGFFKFGAYAFRTTHSENEEMTADDSDEPTEVDR